MSGLPWETTERAPVTDSDLDFLSGSSPPDSTPAVVDIPRTDTPEFTLVTLLVLLGTEQPIVDDLTSKRLGGVFERLNNYRWKDALLGKVARFYFRGVVLKTSINPSDTENDLRMVGDLNGLTPFQLREIFQSHCTGPAKKPTAVQQLKSIERSIDRMLGEEPEQEGVVSDPKPVLEEAVPDIYPEHLLSLPGALGEFAQWVTETAIRPQPKYSVAAALIFGAAVLAQRFVTSTGARSNLYMFLIGPSSAGKEHPIQSIKAGLESAGLSARIAGEQLKSGPGVFAAVAENTRAVFLLDEFGEYMRAASASSAHHKADAITALLTLYSKTNSIHYGAPSADAIMNPRKDLHYPCVNFMTTTTPKNFYDSLSLGHVQSGFVGRTLFVEVEDRPAKVLSESRPGVPTEVADWARHIASQTDPAGNLAGVSSASPVVIPMDAEAVAELREFDHWLDCQMVASQDTGLDAIWGKGGEHTAKIALILAMSEQAEYIALSHVQWAKCYVKYHLERMADSCDKRIGDSPFHKRWKMCYGRIRESGKMGLTTSQMGRCAPFNSLTPREHEEVLAYLVNNSFIELQNIKTKGRQRSAYVAIAQAF